MSETMPDIPPTPANMRISVTYQAATPGDVQAVTIDLNDRSMMTGEFVATLVGALLRPAMLGLASDYTPKTGVVTTTVSANYPPLTTINTAPAGLRYFHGGAR
jgi:hypothetical protein